MRQIFNILRKDCRQFWPEILASLAITAVFVWVYPNQWASWQDSFGTRSNSLLDLRHLQILAQTATALVPISWFVVIARIVHAENLIGNRQFWLTRPYDWKLLLAEKFIFVGVSLCLPFLLAQMALLDRAGFSPTTYISGLLFTLLLTAGLFMLPLIAFASVVSTLLRMILIVLGVCIAVIVAAFFSGNFDSGPSLQTPFSDRWSIPTIGVFCFAALIVQYSSRRAWIARSLLLALIPTVALIASNPLERTMFLRAYPEKLPADLQTIHGALASDVDSNVFGSLENDKYVELSIPFEIAGIPPGQTLLADDIRVTFRTADGSTAVADWQASYNQYLSVEQPRGTLDVKVSRLQYRRLSNREAALNVALALTRLDAGNPVSVHSYAGRDLSVPGVGICVAKRGAGLLSNGFSCRYALRQPGLTRLTFPIVSQRCDLPDAPAVVGSSYSWIGSTERDPSDFGITSVWTGDINVPGQSYSEFGSGSGRSFCLGTPITVTPYRLAGRFRIQFSTAPTKLPGLVDPSGVI